MSPSSPPSPPGGPRSPLARADGVFSPNGQLRLLVRKNAAVFKRNWCSTLIILFVALPPAILLLGFSADDTYNRDGYNKYTFETKEQEGRKVEGMARCADFNMDKCTTDLAVVTESPMSSYSANMAYQVVDRLKAANPFLKSSPSPIRWFNSSDQLAAEMRAKPQTILQAVHFPYNFDLRHSPSYVVQVNHTSYCEYGSQSCIAQWLDIRLPLHVAMQRATLEAATGETYDYGVSWSRFPNPALPEYARDVAQWWGPLLIMLSCIMSFVVLLNMLVYEKERKLKLLLRVSGVHDTWYWLSWWAFFVLIAVWCGFMWWASGHITGLQLLSKSEGSVVFVLIMLSYLSLTGWAGLPVHAAHASTCASSHARPLTCILSCACPVHDRRAQVGVLPLDAHPVGDRWLLARLRAVHGRVARRRCLRHPHLHVGHRALLAQLRRLRVPSDGAAARPAHALAQLLAREGRHQVVADP